MSIIAPFHLDIAEDDLQDLRHRLRRTRWPEQETVKDWSQGVPLTKIRELCAHWADGYDWRRCEEMLNGFGQYRTEIDGLGIHFLHIRSPEADAVPLIMTHGWPGSIIEFHKVLGPLTDPASHGGDPRDAFHLVVPSLPGYGFSDKPSSEGWSVKRVAKSWAILMQRLGYDRYVAQGGDWGGAITTALAVLSPPELRAIHLTMVYAFPDAETASDWTPEEAGMVKAYQRHIDGESGYLNQQRTRPQTLGYGLADSPAGQAAWIYEKFSSWMDCQGDPTSVLTLDEMLDNIMLYWLPNSGASSARLYWESMTDALQPVTTDVPTGISVFPKEVVNASRRWAENVYHNIIYWNVVDRGGHFAAFEQPQIFVQELRDCFRQFR